MERWGKRRRPLQRVAVQRDGVQRHRPVAAAQIVGTVKDKMTSFVHSFGLTKKYDHPCPMHYLLDFTAKKVIGDPWDDTFPVKFHILDRQTGKWLRTVESTEGAWFVYHILNAFDDEDGNIVVDFSKYHNDTLITYGMCFENLIDRPKEFVPCFGQSRLTRCTIPVASGGPTCTEVLDEAFEMATFNWVTTTCSRTALPGEPISWTPTRIGTRNVRLYRSDRQDRRRARGSSSEVE